MKALEFKEEYMTVGIRTSIHAHVTLTTSDGTGYDQIKGQSLPIIYYQESKLTHLIPNHESLEKNNPLTLASTLFDFAGVEVIQWNLMEFWAICEITAENFKFF